MRRATRAGYSLSTYRQLLRSAIEAGRRFADFETAPTGTGPVLILRHDVDYSLEMAVELARVNADMGVAATFPVLLRGESYNPLGHRARQFVRELIGLGQRIALHHYTLEADDLDDVQGDVAPDLAIAQRAFPELRPVVSWHNPTSRLIERYLHSAEVAGLVNVYSSRFVREMAYFSDSNMRHTAEKLAEVLGATGPRQVHLLIHPSNWVGGGRSMEEIIAATWRYGIRQQEHAFLTNDVYRDCFPAGMPTTLVNGFARRWLRAANERGDRSEGRT